MKKIVVSVLPFVFAAASFAAVEGACSCCADDCACDGCVCSSESAAQVSQDADASETAAKGLPRTRGGDPAACCDTAGCCDEGAGCCDGPGCC